MSELKADQRIEWLTDSFYQLGSWLIISNTGPLLNSLSEFARQQGIPGEIESSILKVLDMPLGEDLESHSLGYYPKALVIVNMTRLDNVALGARVLTRMVNHPAWEQCSGCVAESACPLLLNRRAIQELGSAMEDRVRWVYQRLTAYEQRLTLRQMVAHLALSLTGGIDCREAMDFVKNSNSEGIKKGTDGLEKIAFSEGFFGYRQGKHWPAAGALRAVTLLRRVVFGGPISVEFERRLCAGELMGWATLPVSLEGLSQRWRDRAIESAAVKWRCALRRMVYLFGRPTRTEQYTLANAFVDHFLRSPQLRNFDLWQSDKEISLKAADKNRLLKSCLRVLLEVFSGFSSGQFQRSHDRLYVTLRRSDQAVVQPTQLVIADLSFEDFDLYYDAKKRLPVLRFVKGHVELELALPLLDYIQGRYKGEIGNELARIHLVQLEWFQAKLLSAMKGQIKPHDIRFLSADVYGNVHLHRYFLDEEHNRLEQEHV